MNLPEALRSPGHLRARLAQCGAQAQTLGPAGDQGAADLPEKWVEASVLVGIVERSDGLYLVLTKRCAHLSAHAGQISFPGGRREAVDISPADTALREAHEEIGLDPESVEVLGELGLYKTITGYRVHPIVGWIDNPPDYKADPEEVDEVFEVPLMYVINPDNHKREYRMRNGEKRWFYAIPFGKYYIWGATAGMLVGFAGVVTQAIEERGAP